MDKSETSRHPSPPKKQTPAQPVKSESNCDSLLEAVFDSVPGLLHLYTEDGRLIRWNKQHELMTGYSSEELMNFRAVAWYDEEDLTTLAEEWSTVFSDGYTSTEMHLRFKDGRRVPFYLTGVRVEIEGKPHLVGIGIDITKQRQREAAQRRSKNLLKRAEEIALIGGWQFNLITQEQFWTSQAYRIFGLPEGYPLTDEKLLEIVHPDDRSFVEASRKAALLNGSLEIEYRIVVDGRVKWVQAKANVLFGQDGKPIEFIGVVCDVSDRKRIEEEKERAFTEIKHLKELLQTENIYLKKEIQDLQESEEIIGQSDAMHYVLFRAQQVAQTDSTVLLLGETGTGKGMFACLIHRVGPRKDKPLVTVNCAGLPANLIESELFGREKGAFTSAASKQIGRFELANGGTIFLDDIGELPVELQVKLLRVIDDGEFERLGSPHPIKLDVRIIAATNRNLSQEISKGNFREDLFYRLNIFPISIPPLRQHKEDIPLLVDFFLKKFNKRFGCHITDIPEAPLQSLKAQEWPGNIRELMGVIERTVITSSGKTLHIPEEFISGKAHEARQQTSSY